MSWLIVTLVATPLAWYAWTIWRDGQVERDDQLLKHLHESADKVAELHRLLAERDLTIADLRAEVAAMEVQIEAYEDSQDATDKMMSELRAGVLKRSKVIEAVRRAVADANE